MTDVQQPRWATASTTCGYLDVSGATLRRYTRNGVLTRYPFGPSVRYDLNEVDPAIRGGLTSRTDAVRAALEEVRAAHPIGGRPLMNVADLHRTLDRIADNA